MTTDLMQELRALREDARALRYDPEQLLAELEITRAEGETPADAVRRVLDAARAGTAEVRAMLAEIRRDLAAACEGRVGLAAAENFRREELLVVAEALGMSGKEANTATVDEMRLRVHEVIADMRSRKSGSTIEDTARTHELALVADALGMSASHAGRIDVAGMRQRVLDAIVALRENASENVEDVRRETLDHLARALGTVPVAGDAEALQGQILALFQDPERGIQSAEGPSGDAYEVQREQATLNEMFDRAMHSAFYDTLVVCRIEYVEGWTVEDMRNALASHLSEMRDKLKNATEIRTQAFQKALSDLARGLGLECDDGWTSRDYERAIMTHVETLRESAGTDGAEVHRLRGLLDGIVDECEPQNGETIADTVLRTLRDLKARAAKPARGAGPRLDAVLTALGVEPAAWRTAKPAHLADMVADRVTGRTLSDAEVQALEALRSALGVPENLKRLDALEHARQIATTLRHGGAPSGGDIDAWARDLHNSVIALLQPADYLALEDGDDTPAEDARARVLDLLTELKDWGDGACEALTRLWSDAAESYPLERTPKTRRLATQRVTEDDGETLHEALSDLARGHGDEVKHLDSVLMAGEDLRDVLRKFCDAWTQLSESAENAPDWTNREVHEDVARASYEAVHGAGEWVTADYTLREDLIRAVSEALPSS